MIQIMGQMIVENNKQQQPQQLATQPPLPYPATCSLPNASQSATDELVASMKGTNLVNGNDDLTKRRKQHDNMDLHDHSPLTTPTISITTPKAKMDDAEPSHPLRGQQ